MSYSNLFNICEEQNGKACKYTFNTTVWYIIIFIDFNEWFKSDRNAGCAGSWFLVPNKNYPSW